MKKWISLKIMFERAKMYVAWIQFVMIGWIFILQTDLNLYMTLLLVVSALGVLSLIDFKWILPAELNKMAEKNPVIMSIRKDVSKIRDEMKTPQLASLKFEINSLVERIQKDIDHKDAREPNAHWIVNELRKIMKEPFEGDV